MKVNIGKVVGVVLFTGATAAIWLWPNPEMTPPPDDSVRPVRSTVVTAGARMPDLYFAGKVKANEDRMLAFKQSGRIQRIPVSAGQKVRKGDKLAWLNSLDFENDLAKAAAAEQRDRLTCERKREAAKKKAISQEELSQAEAQLRQSEAQLALSKRALEDTVLVAPFDGRVAKIPGTELDMVTPADPVILIQDVSKIKVDVVFPETLAISAPRFSASEGNADDFVPGVVSFDSVPGRTFPATFVEYVATPDTKTQTYVATYIMEAPSDLLLLPGMSATMLIKGADYHYATQNLDDAMTLPETAIGAADDGGHFVWVLSETGEKGVYAAKRRSVVVSYRTGETVTVTKGVESGERVATAGVMELTEGRRVRLLAE